MVVKRAATLPSSAMSSSSHIVVVVVMLESSWVSSSDIDTDDLPLISGMGFVINVAWYDILFFMVVLI